MVLFVQWSSQQQHSCISVGLMYLDETFVVAGVPFDKSVFVLQCVWKRGRGRFYQFGNGTMSIENLDLNQRPLQPSPFLVILFFYLYPAKIKKNNLHQ